MNEKEFEQLWQRAEATAYAKRLASGFPRWQHRRKGRLAIVGLALVTVTALPLMLHQSPSHQQQRAKNSTVVKNYEQVICNRQGTSDAQWSALAADLLMES
ncbi:MAG: hypothetical protein Q4D03_00185 [Bacteroidales bacterium]|nr:hypothetical protein [Bacteroidales bacterium]